MGKERGVYVIVHDPATGALTVDPSLPGDPDRPGYIDLATMTWPHGDSGPAWAHSALFLPAPDR